MPEGSCPILATPKHPGQHNSQTPKLPFKPKFQIPKIPLDSNGPPWGVILTLIYNNGYGIWSWGIKDWPVTHVTLLHTRTFASSSFDFFTLADFFLPEPDLNKKPKNMQNVDRNKYKRINLANNILVGSLACTCPELVFCRFLPTF